MNAPEAKRIVVVDDDLLLAEALQIAWERENDLNIIGVAVTGAEGVELAITTHPDVVLLDHNLPDMNGTEAMVVLSEMLPDVAVVIMTIDPTDQTLRRGRGRCERLHRQDRRPSAGGRRGTPGGEWRDVDRRPDRGTAPHAGT